MRILAIETSCDETALCIMNASGTADAPIFEVENTALFSQIKIHEPYGGVFPMLAKREHGKNLIPLLQSLLGEITHSNGTEKILSPTFSKETEEKIKKMLEREPELLQAFLTHIPNIKKPNIDALAVTKGPGLEPALWVGINFAHALSAVWNIPIIATNHMEGHIVSPFIKITEESTFKETSTFAVSFPAVALLISGGHTELVAIESWGNYKVIGKTRDDAVGEAYDKVARVLHLPYPGGPKISELAQKWRNENNILPKFNLPRPMLTSDDIDFSFSGLKTAVLYLVRDIQAAQKSATEDIDEETKKEIACAFEDAVTEVLIKKTKKALEQAGAKSLIIGGGVIANTHIRKAFEKLTSTLGDMKLFIPTSELSTDNAVMIAAAAYLSYLASAEASFSIDIKADGNLHF